MDMTFERKTEQASPEKTVMVPERVAEGGILNSVMLSMLAASSDANAENNKGNPDALAAAVMGRLPHMRGRPQAQIPSAELEADRLSASVTSGSPDAVKAAMGSRLDADLSGVRFHTDAASAARADAMGARAFTAGADVYFGGEGFDPAVAAHELVHTVQQGAVAGGTETVSAPLGGVQMLFGRKKKDKETRAPVGDDPRVAPGRVRMGNAMRLLKGGKLDPRVAKVALARSEDNRNAVVKSGVDPKAESASAAFYNAASDIYAEDHPGAWRPYAAAFRSLEPKERAEAWQAMDEQQLDSQEGRDTLDALDDVGVFSAVGGITQRAFDQATVDGTRAGPIKDQDDYRRMLGYISMLDMSIGMEDRLGDLYNDENWHVDEKNRQAYLIDNVPETLGSGMASSQRDAWLKNYLLRMTSTDKAHDKIGGGGGKPEKAAEWFLYNMTNPEGENDHTSVARNDLLIGNNGEGDRSFALTGMQQAIEDLPKIQKQLRAQFMEESGGELNDVQEEMLERIQISHEYMTNPKMAAIYERLAEIGFSPKGDNEDPSVAKERAKLLRKRDFHRSPVQWFKNLFKRKKE